MNREPYWEYMGRRSLEERLTPAIYKREISEMQKQVHGLEMKVVKLSGHVYDLNYKITILGGDPNQMEFKF